MLCSLERNGANNELMVLFKGARKRGWPIHSWLANYYHYTALGRAKVSRFIVLCLLCACLPRIDAFSIINVQHFLCHRPLLAAATERERKR